jgi:flagellar hook protein FlgE
MSMPSPRRRDGRWSRAPARRGEISPQTLEKSNVDLAREFTRMMLTQNAYNSSATAFRTIDEMTEVARDLAR